MKKRAISIFLALVMVLCLVPVTSLAKTNDKGIIDLSDGSVTITDTGYTVGSTTYIYNDSITIFGNSIATGNTITINASRDVVFDNVLIGTGDANTNNRTPLTIGAGANVNLTLIGENKLGDGWDNYHATNVVVNDNASLTIGGSGVLKCSESLGHNKFYIGTNARVIFRDKVDLNIRSSYVSAVSGNGDFIIDGGMVKLRSDDANIFGDNISVYINGGTAEIYTEFYDKPSKELGSKALNINGGCLKSEVQNFTLTSAFTMTSGTVDLACAIPDTVKSGSVLQKGILIENGNYTIYGEQNLTSELTLATLKSLTVVNDAILTIRENATLTCSGNITNNGTISVSGDVISTGTVTNNGLITGGTFKESVTNNGTITGGTYYGGILGTGTIDGLTVTYKNGNEDYAVQVVQNGDNAVNPIAPTKTGYLFDGWYEDEECTKAFDFENTKITENRTIYSKWKVCDHTGNTNDLSCTEDTICSVCSGTIKAAHSLSWKADATHYWQECIREGCDYTTVNNKKEIPTIEIKGKDKVHTDQDYSFSFELPEDSTVVRVEYEIPMAGSFNLKVNAENGIYTGVMSKDNYVAGAENFKVIVTVMMNDGYSFEERKNVMLTDEHEGGTATCKEQTVCQICLQPYGSTNPNNHANLKHFSAKAATAAEEGNKEYWYCDGCKKYFSDENAENEINSADTVIAKFAPSIIKGDGQTVTEGEKKTLEFTSDAAFEDFISVEVDGKTIDESNYTVKSGSIVVTLNADYVATLSAGEHTLGIVSQSGTATAKFTVNEKVEETTTTTDKPTANDETKSPLTGNDTAVLWVGFAFISIGVVMIFKRKRKYNR